MVSESRSKREAGRGKLFLLRPEFSPERSFLFLGERAAGRWRRRRRGDWSWKEGGREAKGGKRGPDSA